MKSTTYISETTTQRMKVSVWGKETRIHLLTSLLALCQLRNFAHEFTEKCFAIFDRSTCVIYLTWYQLLLFFQDFFSITPFMVWLQDSSQIKGRGSFLCLALSVNAQSWTFAKKSLYMVTYVCQNFGVCDVPWYIPKNISGIIPFTWLS